MILNIKLDEIDPATGDVGHYLVSCRRSYLLIAEQTHKNQAGGNQNRSESI